jgi:hypothetical protein
MHQAISFNLSLPKMHGRPRQPARALTPDDVAKIEKYNKHKNIALASHQV